MGNKKVLPLLFSILLLLSCSKTPFQPEEDDSRESENPPTEDVDMNITYDDIYHYEYSRSDQKVGLTNYRASDGYIDNDKQGYNNFYYQTKNDEDFINLIFDNNEFVFNDAKISQNKMTSSTSYPAIRTFMAPENGKARVFGSAFLLAGANAHLSIYQNQTLIVEKDVDKDGFYHSDELDLRRNDILRFILEGDATISYNPSIDYSLASETTLHHSADGYYGDVHPFYNLKEKKMYMFYLSTGNQKGEKHQTFESLLTTSSDFIHYNATPIQMDDKGRPEQDLYYVLNVFQDKNGLYRSSMGTSNHTTTSVSKDLLTWSNGTEPYIDPEDDLFKYRYAAYYDNDVYQGRDPDMYYDAEKDMYYSVVLTYLSASLGSGEKAITLYIGNGKGEFSTTGYRLLDFTGRGDPECPQIKKIGNRWYLLYSVSGTGTKGNVGKCAYRIGDENKELKDIDWKNKEEFYLDGEDLHAAQINQVGNKYYLYGWLNYKYNTNIWGGPINLPHEVYQDEHGILRSKLDEKLLSLLNKGLIYKDNKTYISNEALSVKLTRNLITADIEMNNQNDTGLKIKHGSDDYFIGIKARGNKKYLTIDNEFDDYKIEMLAKDSNKYHLTISLDGNYLDVNVNDDTSLSALTNLTDTAKSLSMHANGNIIKNLKISQLADYNNIYF